MHCPRCRIALPDHAFSCPKCGADFAKSSRANSPWLRAALVLILLLAVAVWAFRSGRFTSLLTFSSSQSAYAQSITDANFTIDANKYASYRFTVPAGASSVYVEGHFTAAQSSSMFDVFILRDDAFTNWSKGGQVRALYDSRHSPPNRIFVFLPAAPATYDLVFNNQFSFDASASVTASATLHYTK